MPQHLPIDELSIVIARIQGLLLTEEKVGTAVSLLARAAKESVPGTIGAGVSLLDSRGRRTSSGYTDGVVEQADAEQYRHGEGHCLTAWAAEIPVLVQDLHDDMRWPLWRDSVRELPIRSVVSAPLMAGKEAIGALKLYAATPSGYDETSVRLIQLFAGPAATLLSHVQGSEAPRKMTEGLQTSLHSRDVINRACGVVMERLGTTHKAALQQLMNQARNERTTLLNISESILAGTPASGI